MTGSRTLAAREVKRERRAIHCRDLEQPGVRVHLAFLGVVSMIEAEEVEQSVREERDDLAVERVLALRRLAQSRRDADDDVVE